MHLKAYQSLNAMGSSDLEIDLNVGKALALSRHSQSQHPHAIASATGSPKPSGKPKEKDQGFLHQPITCMGEANNRLYRPGLSELGILQ